VLPGLAHSFSAAGRPTRGPFSLLLPLTTGSRALGTSPRCLPPHNSADDRAPSRPGPPVSRAVPLPAVEPFLRCARAPLALPRSTSTRRPTPLTPLLRYLPAAPPLKKGTPPPPAKFSLLHAVIPPLCSDIAPATPFPASCPPPHRSPEPLLP
jgi:hypothetical protein